MRYYDISPLISEKTAVFPGDVAFGRSISLDFKKGNHLQLSWLTTTPHIGAHADSAGHYHADGAGIEARELDHYFGDCQVLTVTRARGERIEPKDLPGAIVSPRVLLKTGSFPNPDQWNSDFNSLSPALIYFLHSKKVITVGIDTPSVDPQDSKSLESHQALYQSQMAVLEGLVLAHVPDGIYKLVALPLRLAGADASPVRAILLKPEAPWLDSGLQQVT